jgi:histidine triad (HIT) family protein
MTDCLFCKIVAGDAPADIVLTTDTTVAFRDINPVAPVHVLVVPRRHIVNASTVESADAQDVVDVVTTARQVAEAEGIAQPERGYRLVFNVGADALNSVPHRQTLTWPPG